MDDRNMPRVAGSRHRNNEVGTVTADSLWSKLRPEPGKYIAPVRKALTEKFLTVSAATLEDMDQDPFLCRICLGMLSTPITTGTCAVPWRVVSCRVVSCRGMA